jgi:Kef-type K+ transport system membrane component KefB
MEQFIQLTIFLIVIVLLARLASLLSARFGLPSVTIQLLVGVLLGPSLLNVLGSPIVLGTWGSPSPSPIHTILKILAEIGLIQLMFLAALHADWHELRKALKSSFSVGAWEFALSAVGVTILTRVFVGRWTEALAVASIMTASGFGISAYNLSEMKLIGSRAGNVILGVATLSGVLAILFMVASQATNYAITFGVFRMTVAVSWFLGKLVMFFAIAYFLTSRFLKLSANRFQKRPRQMLIGYVLLVASLYAWAAMHFGSFAAVGVASLGGALLGMSNFEIKEKISKGFESTLTSLPVGILFVVLGMEINLKGSGGTINFLVVLLAAVIGAKLIGYWVATNFETSYDRGLIMFGVLPQGEIGMLIAGYLFSRGLVNSSQFNAAITVVILLTMLTPMLMKVAPLERRQGGTIVAPLFTKRGER